MPFHYKCWALFAHQEQQKILSNEPDISGKNREPSDRGTGTAPIGESKLNPWMERTHLHAVPESEPKHKRGYMIGPYSSLTALCELDARHSKASETGNESAVWG